ncbi:MAG TPA: carbamoyltransferase HypF [Stellaceae bacterium]|nr:carbamoyltransferase HypF [Stellaceae bacterium]
MALAAASEAAAVEVRVRGRVQGVGFRPTVWRLAREFGLDGEVLNDGDGVLIRLRGATVGIEALLSRLRSEPPPLARIDEIERRALAGGVARGFRIVESSAGAAHTEVAPDAAVCAACAAEVRAPRERRHGYAFTNCTHCGPRLSIVRGIPYDRARTTMAAFPLCADCAAEYRDPADRRFHAEPIACAACGPRLALVRLGAGSWSEFCSTSPAVMPAEAGIHIAEASAADASVPAFAGTTTGSIGGDLVGEAARLIAAGKIIAVKGLGGYQLACDATNASAVERLRRRKRRDAKPFALMARDLATLRCYCAVSPEEERALGGASAPIVLLRATGPQRLPEAVAPGLDALGFMLPTTPLHLLLLDRVDGPVVMTSGNLSDEPQATDDGDAFARLAGIADYALTHDRGIANRVDDSVVRVVAGRARLIRRARGYAPEPIPLPPGFEAAPEILAMGGELKATFCLVKDGRTILSQHQGDLEHPAVFADYRKNLALYRELFEHRPTALVADPHPEYLSAKLAREWAESEGLPLVEVQHHHAHVAACLAENGRPLTAPPVLGIVLDGLGWGDDGTLWGGEFLLADYRGYRRLASLAPAAMPGGAAAVREPWRNLYAQLMRAMPWPEFSRRFPGLECRARLAEKPLPLLDRMIAGGINSPAASSCGRLFDAVAAALGLCFDRQAYEGEAAMRLEAMVDAAALDDAEGYSFDLQANSLSPTGGEGWGEGAGGRAAAVPSPTKRCALGPPSPAVRERVCRLDPVAIWEPLLRDLAAEVPQGVIGARFHKGLADAVAEMAARLGRAGGVDAVALSGGCFQNAVLFTEVAASLERRGLAVLAHTAVPANDGGLALGQAAVAAARLIEGGR